MVSSELLIYVSIYISVISVITLDTFMESSKMVKREQFNQAKHQWDLERLYNDLASVKGKNLTPMEKLHLRGLLCGYSPVEIAEKLYKELRGIETDLSATVYRYIKGLVNKKIENWRNVSEYLEQTNYKIQSSFLLKKQQGVFLPIEDLKGLVTISHNSNCLKHNQKIVEINIRLVTSLSDDKTSDDKAE